MKLGNLAFTLLAIVGFGFTSVVKADTAGGEPENDTEIAVMLPEEHLSDVPFEKIGIASLTVTLEFEDVNIPGPNGLDLKIKRTYNGSRVYPVAGFGDGWHLGFPLINVNRRLDSTAPLTNLGCIGDVYFVKFIFNNTYTFPVGFQNKEQLKTGTIAAFPDNSILLCEDGNPVHINPDGVKTIFGKYSGAVNTATSYLPTKIVDLFGNSISYSYELFTHPTLGYQYNALKSMERNDGAKVEFEYTTIDGRPWIKRAFYLDREVKYSHSEGLKAQLEEVEDQEGQVTTFGYDTLGKISSVKQPHGLKVTYGWRGPCSSDTALNCLNLHKKTISGPGIDSRTLYYIWSYRDQTVVTENESEGVQNRIERYNFVQFRASPSPLGGLVKKITVTQNDKQILLIESDWDATILGEIGCPRRVIAGAKTYVYQPQNIYCGRVTKKQHKVTVFNEVGSDFYLSNTIDHDVFGKPLNVSLTNTSTFDEKHNKYTWYNDITNWVVAKPASVSISTDKDIYLRQYIEKTRYEYYKPDSAQKSALKSKYFSGRLTDTYFYHANGELKRHEKGTAQRWVEYANYKRGIAQQTSVPDRYNASAKAFSYKTVNDEGTVSSETNFNGVKVNYEYDMLGRVTLSSYEDNSNEQEITTYSADSGQLVSTTTKGNYSKEIKFDAFLRPAQIKERDVSDQSVVRHSSQSYNHKGRIAFRSFPSDAADVTQGYVFEYDGLQRLTRHYENINQTGTNWYYQTGNKVKVVDAKGHATTTTYLAFDVPEYKKAKRIEQPESVTTDIVYNQFDNPLTITQGGHTESRIYDEHQNLCRLVRADVGTTVFSYKTTGELDWLAEGQTTSGDLCNVASVPVNSRVTHSYDNRGDLHQIVYPDSTPSKVSVLDADGNLLSLTSGSAIWEYEYNSQAQKDKEILTLDNLSWIVDPTYNRSGHLTSLTYPSGKIISFAPNVFGQPTNAGSYANSAVYHPMGELSSFSYGNGLKFSQTLDELQRPDILKVSKETISIIGLDHSYDDNNNISDIVDLITTSKNITLTYDGLNRLDTASGFWGTGDFDYDSLGNIKKKTLGSHSLTYTYNGSNRLMGISGSLSRTFGYDTRGNITGNSQRSFTFNLANQLVTSGTNSYQYDGYNRRVKKVSNGTTQYSLYNAAGQLLVTDGDNGLTEYFYLGNKLVAKESPVPTSEDTPGYTGHLEDDDLQLTYMQQRYYDPLIGRFYSNDPIVFSPHKPMLFNRYAYANNNPYAFIDPDGRESQRKIVMPSVSDKLASMLGFKNATEGNNVLESKVESGLQAVDAVGSAVGDRTSVSAQFDAGMGLGVSTSIEVDKGTLNGDGVKVEASLAGAKGASASFTANFVIVQPDKGATGPITKTQIMAGNGLGGGTTIQWTPSFGITMHVGSVVGGSIGSTVGGVESRLKP